MEIEDYNKKYLKYKQKYLELKKQMEGGTIKNPEYITEIQSLGTGSSIADARILISDPKYTDQLHKTFKDLIIKNKMQPSLELYLSLYDIYKITKNKYLDMFLKYYNRNIDLKILKHIFKLEKYAHLITFSSNDKQDFVLLFLLVMTSLDEKGFHGSINTNNLTELLKTVHEHLSNRL